MVQTPMQHFSAFEDEVVLFFGRSKKIKDSQVRLRYYKGDADKEQGEQRQEVKCVHVNVDPSDHDLLASRCRKGHWLRVLLVRNKLQT